MLAEGTAAGADVAADALWLGAAGLVAGELGELAEPAELAELDEVAQAVNDIVAAAAIRASTLGRKAFISPSSVVLVITSRKARPKPGRAGGCAQTRDSGRDFGPVIHDEPDAHRRALAPPLRDPRRARGRHHRSFG